MYSLKERGCLSGSPPGGDFSDPVTSATLSIVQFRGCPQQCSVAGKEGEFEKTGHGARPYTNWETVRVQPSPAYGGASAPAAVALPLACLSPACGRPADIVRLPRDGLQHRDGRNLQQQRAVRVGGFSHACRRLPRSRQRGLPVGLQRAVGRRALTCRRLRCVQVGHLSRGARVRTRHAAGTGCADAVMRAGEGC